VTIAASELFVERYMLSERDEKKYPCPGSSKVSSSVCLYPSFSSIPMQCE
jgi:hypothetical protein